MDCRKLVRQALTRWREINKTRPDRNVGSLRRQFSRFAKEARPDLEFLCARGANPFVLIWIIDTHLWWWGGVDMELTKRFDSDLRNLSSHTYWSRCMKSLDKTAGLLSALHSNLWVQIMARMNPRPGEKGLVEVARCALRADSAVKDLLETIRALKVNQAGWELVKEPLSELPGIRWTGKKGKRSSGRSREADWGMCAAVLHAYLVSNTGRPHWVSIVRLLGFSGVKWFGVDIGKEGEPMRGGEHASQREFKTVLTGAVKKRVKRLRMDPAVCRRIEKRVCGYEVMFGRDGLAPLPI